MRVWPLIGLTAMLGLAVFILLQTLTSEAGSGPSDPANFRIERSGAATDAAPTDEVLATNAKTEQAPIHTPPTDVVPLPTDLEAAPHEEEIAEAFDDNAGPPRLLGETPWERSGPSKMALFEVRENGSLGRVLKERELPRGRPFSIDLPPPGNYRIAVHGPDANGDYLCAFTAFRAATTTLNIGVLSSLESRIDVAIVVDPGVPPLSHFVLQMRSRSENATGPSFTGQIRLDGGVRQLHIRGFPFGEISAGLSAYAPSGHVGEALGIALVERQPNELRLHLARPESEAEKLSVRMRTTDEPGDQLFTAFFYNAERIAAALEWRFDFRGSLRVSQRIPIERVLVVGPTHWADSALKVHEGLGYSAVLSLQENAELRLLHADRPRFRCRLELRHRLGGNAHSLRVHDIASGDSIPVPASIPENLELWLVHIRADLSNAEQRITTSELLLTD